jgi:hypothetical protein
MPPACLDLHIGRRRTTASIHPDPIWPGMWRIHQGDRVSDMLNLTRAKDAAIGWACPRGLNGNLRVSWHARETPPEARYSAFPPGAATTLAPGE